MQNMMDKKKGSCEECTNLCRGKKDEVTFLQSETRFSSEEWKEVQRVVDMKEIIDRYLSR